MIDTAQKTEVFICSGVFSISYYMSARRVFVP